MMQERDLKLWDRCMTSVYIEKEPMRDKIGCLSFYDPDEDSQFVVGNGSCSAKRYEVDVARAPSMHALIFSTLNVSTLAAKLPAN